MAESASEMAPGSSLRQTLVKLARRDGWVLLLFVAAVIAMTYPMAFRLGAGLPSDGGDILTAHWQVWWLREAVKSGHSANFTPYLLYPNGMDVTFQPHPWTSLLTWGPLALLFGDAAGYNLNTMLGLLVSAYGTYLLVRHLTGNRAAAWVSGAFYAFYPSHVFRVVRQPTTGSIQWFPFFMLALVVGLEEVAASDEPRRNLTRRGLAMMVLAGLTLSVNAYISIKPLTQVSLLGALYVSLAALINGWWRNPAFWKAIGVLALVSLLLVSPILAPYLRAGAGLQNAIDQGASSLSKHTADAVAYVRASPDLPLFVPRSLAGLTGTPFTDWERGGVFYLGLMSIALAAMGLVDVLRRDRQRWLWPIMAAVIWSLSLGTRLSFDGERYPQIWLPYRLLETNPVFAAVRIPHRFSLGFSLPFAVLVGYGVVRLWEWFDTRRRLAPAVIAGLSLVMLFELALVPLTLTPLEVSPFYDQLRAEGAEGAIIDVPTGIGHAKRHMYLQTVHHRPIVTGRIARMPEDAFDYIQANPLLQGWREKTKPNCKTDLGQAIDNLLADGFRYVVVHNPAKHADWVAGYFLVEPIYEDDLIAVYSLPDMRDNPPCE